MYSELVDRDGHDAPFSPIASSFTSGILLPARGYRGLTVHRLTAFIHLPYFQSPSPPARSFFPRSHSTLKYDVEHTQKVIPECTTRSSGISYGTAWGRMHCLWPDVVTLRMHEFMKSCIYAVTLVAFFVDCNYLKKLMCGWRYYLSSITFWHIFK